MNSTDDKKAFGELKAKYEDRVYPDDSHRAIIAPGPSGPDVKADVRVSLIRLETSTASAQQNYDESN